MKIHVVGAGGIAMSGVAGLLKEIGHTLQGSDKGTPYPPASFVLKRINLEIKPFSEENIKSFSPDAVIVGNSIKAENPEVRCARDRKIPLFSFPSFLKKHVLKDKKVLVCAGTHGKTTTTSLLAHTLEFLGEEPSYLVGGVLRKTGLNFKKGNSSWMVIEGDEYPSAFFDPSPKFLHYTPLAVLLTSLEYDHADVYPDFSSLRNAFLRLLSLIPEEGLLVYCADYTQLDELISSLSLKCRVRSYGLKKGEARLLRCKSSFSASGFSQKVECMLPKKGKISYTLNLPGDYNALNSLGVLLLLSELGIDPEEAAKSFQHFRGVKRRQEVVFSENNLVIIDDFAHHPTAVAHTMREVKKAFSKGWKLAVLFEPRTNSSKRKVFQEAYISALSGADFVYLKTPPGLENLPENERIDLEHIKHSLENLGKKAYLFKNASEIKWVPEVERLILLCMSSASLDKEIEILKGLFNNGKRVKT